MTGDKGGQVQPISEGVADMHEAEYMDLITVLASSPTEIPLLMVAALNSCLRVSV